MSARCLAVLVIVGGAACTGSPSGPAHWRRACAHFASLTPGGEHKEDAAECERAHAGLPLAVADDLARCVLRLEAIDEDHTVLRSCWREETRQYFDTIDRGQRAADDLAKAVTDYNQEHDRPPRSLADLPGKPNRTDVWGTNYRLASDEGNSVLSAGPDKRFGTPDDLTGRAEFIYFQF
ncbi:MAG: hypothetical protein AAF721_33295 [Myxococcota bacterium]